MQITFRIPIGSAFSQQASLQLALKMGRENPVPTGSAYRLNQP